MSNIRRSDMDTIDGQTKIANVLLSKINSLIGRVAMLETRLDKALTPKAVPPPVIMPVKRPTKKGAVK